jgi:hypothetical protein
MCRNKENERMTEEWRNCHDRGCDDKVQYILFHPISLKIRERTGGNMWTGCVWPRIGTCGGLLWGGGDFLTSWVTISFSRRTLLYGVS